MTISPIELYFLLKLDALRIVMLVFAIVMTVAGIVTLLVVLFDDRAKLRKKWPLVMVTIGTGLFFAFAAMPSTKEMLAISIVPKVVNSELVQKDVPEEAKEVYAALKKWLIEQATDVTGTSQYDSESVSYMKGYQLRKLIEEAVRNEFKVQEATSND